MTSAFSSQYSISLCPASFRIPRPNLLVTPDVSWLPTFAFQSPIMKRTSFWGVTSRRFVGVHRTIQLQLIQHYSLGHRLGLLWYWMVCLGNKQRSFCRFWDCIQVLHFRLLLTMMATPLLVRDSCLRSMYTHIHKHTCTYIHKHTCTCIHVCMCSLSYVQLFKTPRMVVHQALVSMIFSRQEYWNGVQFPIYTCKHICIFMCAYVCVCVCVCTADLPYP